MSEFLIIALMSADPSSAQTLPPPTADPQVAAKYVDWLTELINKDKITVNHSDLTKFSVDCMEDHYRIGLEGYDVELSHSKHPKSGEDIYTMIFNNLAQLGGSQAQRVILAYIHLTKAQFEKFKSASDTQMHRKWREAEDKRFKEAMSPIDEVLEKISSSNGPSQETLSPQEETSQTEPASPREETITNASSVQELNMPLPEPMKLPPVPSDTPSSISEALNQTPPLTISQLAEQAPKPQAISSISS
jgi:hypothetical protein